MVDDAVKLSVRVNDIDRLFTRPMTLAAIVAGLSAVPAGWAAAVNGDVVPRDEWARRQIEDGDTVEIVSPQPGG